MAPEPPLEGMTSESVGSGLPHCHYYAEGSFSSKYMEGLRSEPGFYRLSPSKQFSATILASLFSRVADQCIAPVIDSAVLKADSIYCNASEEARKYPYMALMKENNKDSYCPTVLSMIQALMTKGVEQSLDEQEVLQKGTANPVIEYQEGELFAYLALGTEWSEEDQKDNPALATLTGRQRLKFNSRCISRESVEKSLGWGVTLHPSEGSELSPLTALLRYNGVHEW